MIIEGAISVKAAIENKNRDIDTVYIDIDKKTKDFNYIRKIVRNNNIKLIETSRTDLENLASGKTFGGVLASVTNRKENEFIDGDIFYLDGIEDPFNLGYAMRTLYAFGIKNLLLEKKDYSNMEAQLLKSSAGAYDMLNIKYSDNCSKLISEYKKQDYTIYGLFRGDNSLDVFNEEFNNKSLIILGGEKRGINAELLNLCDKYLYIPYGSNFRNSLNACAALDVVATLLFNKRK